MTDLFFLSAVVRQNLIHRPQDCCSPSPTPVSEGRQEHDRLELKREAHAGARRRPVDRVHRSRVDGRSGRSGGAAFVAMMKSAHFRERDHAPFRRRLHASRRRRVFLQGEMCAGPMIIGDIRGQEPSQMPLAEDDDVVETLAANGSDQRSAYGLA